MGRSGLSRAHFRFDVMILFLRGNIREQHHRESQRTLELALTETQMWLGHGYPRDYILLHFVSIPIKNSDLNS
jgi:hypothetical protein